MCVMDGRQISISRALRALSTPMGFQMKLLSFNCQGLAIPSKRLALQRLLEITRPDIVMLQETLGAEVVIVLLLERLQKGWSFFGLDASGRFGGLAMGWNQKSIKLESS